MYHCRPEGPSCPVKLVAWDRIVKQQSGKHSHESAKDKISCMLVEQEQLEKALEDPKSATLKDLATSISSKLMKDDNVLLNNVGLMASEKTLRRRLQRGKEKLEGNSDLVRRKMPKYFDIQNISITKSD